MQRLLSLVLLGVLILVPGAAAAQEASLPPELAAELQALLQVTYESSDDLPGMVLLVDTEAGQFASAVGYANLENQVPLSVEHTFRIGSISKMMTAVLILQQAEEGVLSLDDPLAAWLPELAAALPHGEEITIRHLLNHSAGVAEYLANEVYYDDLLAQTRFEGGAARFDCGQEAESILRDYVLEMEPFFPPSESGDFEYSNSHYLLLGLILEAATGEPLATLYREWIFEPLGMTSSYTFCGEAPIGQLTHGYSELDGQVWDVVDFNDGGNLADGTVVSTAQDLLRFGQGLAAGELFEAEATLATMLADPFLNEYGLGVMVMDDLIGHSGGMVGYLSYLMVNLDSGAAIVLLVNTDITDPTDILWEANDLLIEYLDE
ncbi:MAG: beta-lactamase family protein [Anaerolineae bacterium]|nr:beta-lactamase family protein [Anaerolineae bacterium]